MKGGEVGDGSSFTVECVIKGSGMRRWGSGGWISHVLKLDDRGRMWPLLRGAPAGELQR